MSEIFGTPGDDILDGTSGADIITGDGGSDLITGRAGDDSIDGGGGEDTLIGGSGNDTLTGNGSGDELNGTDDVAAGIGEIDVLKGSSGSDRFILGDETQAYYTATGSLDYVFIDDFKSFQDTIQLNGLPGDYSLSQVDVDTHLLRGGELVAILAGTTAAELDLNASYFTYVGSGVNLTGTDADEVLAGTDGFDFIAGGGGNDTITGEAGVDDLQGEDGNDSLNGGAGNDILDGGGGNDIIEGGAGDDVINGGGGEDTLIGGIGNDTLTGGGSGDTLNGTDDTVAGAGEIDIVKGSSGSDLFILGDEIQTYYKATGDTDYALIDDFKSFQDTIQLNGLPDDYSLSQVDTNTHLLQGGELIAVLANTTAADLDIGANYFNYVGSGVNLVGTDADEVLDGTNGFDTIVGGGGNDTIAGKDNADNLQGEDGNDILDGGAGNDILDGGAGDDLITGGIGDDVMNGAGGEDTLTGGSGNDNITGGGSGDILNGTDDTAAGAGELDFLKGSSGADQFILGNEMQAYYAAAGDADYVTIDDFKTFQDTIQLNGLPSDYSLNQVDADTHLLQSGELVAVLADTTAADFDLSADYFSYIGAAANTPPTAVDDSVTTDEDTVLNIDAAELLGNDSDPDVADTLQITAVDNASNGTVELDAEGNISFTPDLNFNGAASFDYTVSDSADSSTASVSVLVNPVNDAPIATEISDFTVTDNAPDTVIDLTAIFSDVEDSDTELTFEIVNNTDSSLFRSFEVDREAGTLVLDYAWRASGTAELILSATDTDGASVETTFEVNVLNATFFGDWLTGAEGDDYLNGSFGRDRVFGNEGDDTLIGGNGSDRLSGGTGNDYLDGTGRFGAGIFERDALTGGEGSDTFVLGNAHKAYYTGLYHWDYAVLHDFVDGEDNVQLHGSATEYRTVSGWGNTYLYHQAGSNWCPKFDLVAVFEDNTNFDLNSSSVEFVS